MVVCELGFGSLGEIHDSLGLGKQKIQTIKQCSDYAELNPTFEEEEYRKMAALPLAATERSVAFSERVGASAFSGQGDIRLPGVSRFSISFSLTTIKDRERERLKAG